MVSGVKPGLKAEVHRSELSFINPWEKLGSEGKPPAVSREKLLRKLEELPVGNCDFNIK